MMSLFSNIFRRLHRQKIVRRLTAHDLMEKALKISANNVIIYDIPHQHVIKVSGKMLPDGVWSSTIAGTSTIRVASPVGAGCTTPV